MLQVLTAMLHGLGVTLELTVLSFVIAALAGTVLAVMRVGPVPSLRMLGTAYVEVIRNIPLLVLMILFVFGLPEIGVRYSLFTSAVICISGYEACYICEALRSGINTIAVGQAEAARAIGLTFGQTLRCVILPQAFRSVVQPIGNVFIGLALNTSLAAAIGVVELTGQADRLDLAIVRPIPLFFGAGLGYVLITLSAGMLTGVIERRVAFRR